MLWMCISVLDHVCWCGRYLGTGIVGISFLLKRGTVNSTGNGRDWVIDSQHIQIACMLLAVKGRL
jgi:hypothetical protein